MCLRFVVFLLCILSFVQADVVSVYRLVVDSDVVFTTDANVSTQFAFGLAMEPNNVPDAVPLLKYVHRVTNHHGYSTGALNHGYVLKDRLGLCFLQPRNDTVPLLHFFNRKTGGHFYSVNDLDRQLGQPHWVKVDTICHVLKKRNRSAPHQRRLQANLFGCSGDFWIQYTGPTWETKALVIESDLAGSIYLAHKYQSGGVWEPTQIWSWNTQWGGRFENKKTGNWLALRRTKYGFQIDASQRVWHDIMAWSTSFSQNYPGAPKKYQFRNKYYSYYLCTGGAWHRGYLVPKLNEESNCNWNIICK